jgi:hypothetical protein
MLSKTPILALLLLGTVGCANHLVRVVDASGHPIQGARVDAESLSIDAGALTDANGECQFPNNPQTVNSLKISKPGYRTYWSHVPDQWPYTVTLSPGTDQFELLLTTRP